jgi:hypothetical protein
MNEPLGNKPSLKLPWEIAALRVISLFALIASGFAFIGCAAGEAQATQWFVILFLAGMFMRAVAGIWDALERIANRDE